MLANSQGLSAFLMKAWSHIDAGYLKLLLHLSFFWGWLIFILTLVWECLESFWSQLWRESAFSCSCFSFGVEMPWTVVVSALMWRYFRLFLSYLWCGECLELFLSQLWCETALNYSCLIFGVMVLWAVSLLSDHCTNCHRFPD